MGVGLAPIEIVSVLTFKLQSLLSVAPGKLVEGGHLTSQIEPRNPAYATGHPTLASRIFLFRFGFALLGRSPVNSFPLIPA